MSKKSKLYSIEVIETLSMMVEVSASSEEQALALVKQAYRQESIVLTSENYIQTSFVLNGAKQS